MLRVELDNSIFTTLKKIRNYLKANSVQNAILIGFILYLLNRDLLKDKGLGDLRSLLAIAFTVVIILSFTVSFTYISRLYKKRVEPDSNFKEPLLNTFGLAIGFISVTLLIVISDFSLVVFAVIAIGIVSGIVYGVFWLAGKMGLKLWELFKRHKRQQMHDFFANRPENIKRKQSDDTE